MCCRLGKVLTATASEDEKEMLMFDSIRNGEAHWQWIPGPVVAGSVEDQIAAMREMLTSTDPNREVQVTGTGVIVNPEAPSSLGTNEPISVIPGPVVAAQWYEENPALQQAEIQAMLAFHPTAKYGFLNDGRMYWQIRIRPDILGERKDWTFLAVYDSDHPQRRWGGSVKFYPVSPNYEEMKARVERSSVEPKHIPHMLHDDENQLYLCSQHRDLVEAGRMVTSASTCLRNVIYWVNMFEWGLLDQAIWSEFQIHRTPAR